MDGNDPMGRKSPKRKPMTWQQSLDAHGDLHGFHIRLGHRHGALYTEDEETLLVTFEQAENMRDAGGAQLPMGLAVAGRAGWSQLCLYSEGDTWFRDAQVYELFDTLIDEGFFDEFDKVLFYGAGSCAYAAAAFSVVAPGAEVLLIQPQATLDPRVTEWDDRFPEMRRVSFTDRYGYAPAMMEGAASGAVIYDPYERLDAMHAALFTRSGIEKFRTPHMGRDLAQSFEEMGILVPMILAAGKGELNVAKFAKLYRKRRRVPQYLKRILSRLEEQERYYLVGLHTRAVLRRIQGPRFKRAYNAALKELEKDGVALPESPLDD